MSTMRSETSDNVRILDETLMTELLARVAVQEQVRQCEVMARFGVCEDD